MIALPTAKPRRQQTQKNLEVKKLLDIDCKLSVISECPTSPSISHKETNEELEVTNLLKPNGPCLIPFMNTDEPS